MLLYYLSLVETPEQKSLVESIYYRYKNLIIYLALSKLQDETLAEEALHEVLLTVIEQIKKLQKRDENGIKSFIYLATRNICIDILRKEKRQTVRSVEELPLPLQIATDPQDSLEEKRIVQCVAEMPPIYRDVLELTAFFGMTVKESAKILKISPAACRKRLERARAIIRKKLKEDEAYV